MAEFVHLHVHSEHSLLDGINRIDSYPEYAKKNGMEAVAITDHGNVAGSYKFVKACRAAKIKPIVGIEAYYTVNDHTVREKDDLDEPYYHMVLLAANNKGLHNLFHLSSLSYSEGMYSKPRISDAMLADYSSDLYATSACLGSRASQLILRNRTRDAEKLIEHHAAIFKDRFFIELQCHAGEQERVNSVLMDIARRHNLPLLLTGDCHYTEASDKHLHEIALCMQTNATLQDEKRFSFGDLDVAMSAPDAMATKAKLYGIPEEAILNTVALSQQIVDDYFVDVINRYPRYTKLPPNTTAWEYLEDLAKDGLTEKFGGMPPKHYRDRINEELHTIKIMGFSDYLLIVRDLINRANEIGVWTGPGRGSVGGSLVAYSLGITQVDPIKHNLLFSRFLNAGRSSTPIIFDDKLRRKIEELNVCTGTDICRCREHRH